MDSNQPSVLKLSLFFGAGILLSIAVALLAPLFFPDAPDESSASGAAIAIRIIGEGGGGVSLATIAPALASVFSALVAIAAVYASVVNTERSLKSAGKNAEAERLRAANTAELEQLNTVLSTFHTPFLVRTQANHNMAQDLRNRLGQPGYRMLTSLLEPGWYDALAEADRAIVDEVCNTGEELRTFIETKSGGVSPALAGHLARASAHFRMLKLAHQGKLGNDPDLVKQYVYPRALDLALNADRDRIVLRIRTLRSKLDGDHGLIEPLELPSDAELDSWPDPVRDEVLGVQTKRCR